jgi:hypothetical protein
MNAFGVGNGCVTQEFYLAAAQFDGFRKSTPVADSRKIT